MSQKFKVGSIEYDSFKVYGMSITARDGGFIIYQNSKKVDLELYSQCLLHSRIGDSPASERKHRFAMSTIGSLLFIGRFIALMCFIHPLISLQSSSLLK
jgi:hypothetical protein